MAMKRYNPNEIKSPQDLAQARAYTEAQYTKSCHNILSVIIFTAINIFLLVTNSNVYFLFSAAIPRMLVDFGMFFCGLYPADYYGGDKSLYEFWGIGFFILTLVGALLILGFYLLCWFLAQKKKKGGWLIVAAVLFVIDCILFFYWYGFASDMIIDLVFRAWVLISLILGICAYIDLKKMPTEFPNVASYTDINLGTEEETVSDAAETVAVTDDAETPSETPATEE